MSALQSEQLQPLKLNAALANALDALKSAKAKNIPTAYDVLLSPTYNVWHGLKQDGSHLKLIKHKADSYNVEC
jgi:hypothetical protein